jgi:hypothetical protein
MFVETARQVREQGEELDEADELQILQAIKEEACAIREDYDKHHPGEPVGKEGLIERSRLGIYLLDLECPGWHNDVDTNKLDMSSVYCDVLGQLYGSYMQGCAKLGITGQAFYYGHNAVREEEIYYLKSLWTLEVTDRRIADERFATTEVKVLTKRLRAD